MKKLPSLIILLSLVSISFAQSVTDSLCSVFQDNALHDSVRLNAIGQLVSNIDRSVDLDSAVLEISPCVDALAESRISSLAREAYGKIGSNIKALGNLELARKLYQKSLLVAHRLKDTSQIILAQNDIGTTYLGQDQYDMAKVYLDSALNLSRTINDTVGLGRSLVNTGVVLHAQGNYLEAESYYNKSLQYRRAIGDKKGVGNVLLGLGAVNRRLGNLGLSVKYVHESLSIAEEIGAERLKAKASNTLGNLHSDLGELEKAVGYYQKSLASHTLTGNKKGQVFSNINLGIGYKNLRDFQKAIKHYQIALNAARESGFRREQAKALNNLGSLSLQTGDYKTSRKYLLECLRVSKEIKTKGSITVALANLGKLCIQESKFKEAEEYLLEGLTLGNELGRLGLQASVAERLSELYTKTRDYKKALQYSKQHQRLNDSLNVESARQEMQKIQLQNEARQRAIADSLEFAKIQAVKDLEIEKQEVNLSRQRIALGSSAIGLLLIVALAFSIYKGKRKSDDLLLNILPSETAAELKEKGYADAKQFDQVTVLFTDFKGFTEISERLDPKELVSSIDECFKAFDGIIEKHGIEKIKTIGDAYMAAGGLPIPNTTNPTQAVKAALEIRDWMQDHKGRNGDKGFEIRIGVHTGPVVAGIVGVKKFAYDIWGDTVNTASRMESSGEAGKVNISETTYNSLKKDPQFSFESRGKIEAKGKGQMQMFFVEANT